MRALLRHPAGKLGLAFLLASQPVLGAWIAREPLTQAAVAIHDIAPLVGTYLRLKVEGKL